MSEDNSKAAAKAKAFFEKARKVAETDNFEYAIDMYLQGLRYAPDALMEVAWTPSDRAWAYLNETSIRELPAALEPEGIE